MSATPGEGGEGQAGGPPATKTILVVDPDPDVLQSTALLIEQLGYRAAALAEAAEALEAVEREAPAAILLEFKAPGLNLAGLAASLRASPRTSRIPLILFSASFELAATAARHQAWGHLAKPFGFHELAHVLEKAAGPPPGHVGVAAARDVEKEVRAAFRDYRNHIASLSNYIVLLDRAHQLTPEARATLQRLEDLVLMMEARTDRLRAYILALIGPVEQFRAPERPPGASAEAKRLSRPPATGGAVRRAERGASHVYGR